MAFRFVGADLVRCDVSRYDSDGLPCGAAASLAAGESSPMLRVQDIKDFSFASPPRTRESPTGDGQVITVFFFDSLDPATVNLVFGSLDPDINALFTGTKVRSDNGRESVGVNPRTTNPPVLFFSAQTRGKQDSAAGAFVPGFVTYNAFEVEISVSPITGITQQTVQEYPAEGAANQRSVTPWGDIINVANWGTDRVAGDIAFSVNPYTYVFYEGESNTGDTITLPFKALGDHTTNSVKARAFTRSTGVWAAFTGFTVNEAFDTITITGAENGKRIVFRIETNYEEVA